MIRVLTVSRAYHLPSSQFPTRSSPRKTLPFLVLSLHPLRAPSIARGRLPTLSHTRGKAHETLPTTLPPVLASRPPKELALEPQVRSITPFHLSVFTLTLSILRNLLSCPPPRPTPLLDLLPSLIVPLQVTSTLPPVTHPQHVRPYCRLLQILSHPTPVRLTLPPLLPAPLVSAQPRHPTSPPSLPRCST